PLPSRPEQTTAMPQAPRAPRPRVPPQARTSSVTRATTWTQLARTRTTSSVESRAALDAKDDDLEEDEEELDAEDEADEGPGVVTGSSDDSEDDAPRNRIGNVPLEWYKDEDHVGYDLAGQKVMRTLKAGEIDALLESKDNPDAWRTIK
ncbi:unnamed protein product, partial [Prorocentrum cordatum]